MKFLALDFFGDRSDQFSKSISQNRQSQNDLILLARRRWPILTRSISNQSISDKQSITDKLFIRQPIDGFSIDNVFLSNPQFYQVQQDTSRSGKHFPNLNDQELIDKQNQLSIIIMQILENHKIDNFTYTQGFHEICAVIFVVMEDPIDTFQICDRLACTHFLTCFQMTPKVVIDSWKLIFVLIDRVDPKLGKFLHRLEIRVNFALSWKYAWFAQQIIDYSAIIRLFDFFLSADESMPIYFGAALILHRRDDILALEKKFQKWELAPHVEQFLKELPENLRFQANRSIDNLEIVIKNAKKLFNDFPPASFHKRGFAKRFLLGGVVVISVATVVIVLSGVITTAVSAYAIYKIAYRTKNK